jgi:hypothetical protein
MNIDELLNKYMEGLTTSDEEAFLRKYFSDADDVPPRYAPYKAMFAYFDEERRESFTPVEKQLPRRKRLYATALAAAASVALLILAGRYFYTNNAAAICDCTSGYVVINGRCYTDTDKVKSKALEALQLVSEDDYITGGLFDL